AGQPLLRSATATRDAARVPRARAGSPAGAPMTRRTITFVIVGVVAAIVLIWGFQKWTYSRGHESTDNAQVDGHIIPVLAKVGGYVQQVSVNENQPVQAGPRAAPVDGVESRQRLCAAEPERERGQAPMGRSVRRGRGP